MYVVAKGSFLNDRLMKKFALLFAVLFIALACSRDNVAEKPENLIEQDQMVDMLYDLTLLQASFSVVDVQNKAIDGQKFLKDKYGIDSLTFAKNNKYYAAQPEKYQKMQKQVVERIDAEKKKLEVKKAPAPQEKQKENNLPRR